jgi:hypothetical protein
MRMEESLKLQNNTAVITDGNRNSYRHNSREKQHTLMNGLEETQIRVAAPRLMVIVFIATLAGIMFFTITVPIMMMIMATMS